MINQPRLNSLGARWRRGFSLQLPRATWSRPNLKEHDNRDLHNARAHAVCGGVVNKLFIHVVLCPPPPPFPPLSWGPTLDAMGTLFHSALTGRIGVFVASAAERSSLSHTHTISHICCDTTFSRSPDPALLHPPSFCAFARILAPLCDHAQLVQIDPHSDFPAPPLPSG